MNEGIIQNDNIENEPSGKYLEISYSPTEIYSTIERVSNIKDIYKRWEGETVGKLESNEASNPLVSIETNVMGGYAYDHYIPVSPGSSKLVGVGRHLPYFEIETNIGLREGIFIDEKSTNEVIEKLRESGYGIGNMFDTSRGRILRFTKDGIWFEVQFGWENKNQAIEMVNKSIEEWKAMRISDQEHENELQNELQLLMKDQFKVALESCLRQIRYTNETEVFKCLQGKKELDEKIAEILVEVLAPGNTFTPLKMEWKPKSMEASVLSEETIENKILDKKSAETPVEVLPPVKTVTPLKIERKLKSAEALVWFEENLQSIEDLLAFSIEDINKSLLSAVSILRSGKNSSFLIEKEGMNKGAENTLTIIESYFNDKYKNINIKKLLLLSQKEKSLLALGFALKFAKTGSVLNNGNIDTDSDVSISGLYFSRYGKSFRDKFELLLQQDRKYSYRREEGESAHFFLLNTGKELYGDTIYESLQEQNLEIARNWMKELENKRQGKYSVEDVKELNSLLLKGTVPERYLGRFRTQESYLAGRIEPTNPKLIEGDVSILLYNVGLIIERAKASQNNEDQGSSNTDLRDSKILRGLIKSWVVFDGIHPMEEGNGRTGTLIFESWLKAAGIIGMNEKLNFERRDNRNLSLAMSKAMKGASTIYQINLNNYEEEDPNLEDLLNLVIEKIK